MNRTMEQECTKTTQKKSEKKETSCNYDGLSLVNAFCEDCINPLQSGVANLYPLKTSENLKVF